MAATTGLGFLRDGGEIGAAAAQTGLGGDTGMILYMILNQLGTLLTTAISAPLSGLVACLLYLDQRFRHAEGYRLHFWREQFHEWDGSAYRSAPTAEVRAQITQTLAAEFGPQGVAVNALWPRTLIATDALHMIPGVDAGNGRSPAIMGDAAHAVLTRNAAECNGQFLIDDDVLRATGITDLSHYAVDPSKPLLPDLYLDA